MDNILDESTLITKDMFMRQLEPYFLDYSNELFLEDHYGNPINRFKWTPVYVILGPVWENTPISKFNKGSMIEYEFAYNVPLKKQESKENYKKNYKLWD